MVRSLALFLGFTLLGAAGARAQTAATVYAWSTYPNGETTLNFSTGVAADAAGNVYGSSLADHYVMKISAAGLAAPLAGAPGISGTTDGPAGDARFNAPQGLAVDDFGTVLVADFGSSTIRRILPTGVVTTLAGLAGVRGRTDGAGSLARFSSPRGVALDNIGNVYVTDSANFTIRLITLDQRVQTIAGGTYGTRDAVGTLAQFMMPWGVALDRAGNLYVTDAVAHTVRRLSATGRIATTLAGSPGVKGSADGTAAAARFHEPTGLAIDNTGTLFVTDTQNHTIRRIGTDGQVTTIGGRTDSPGGVVENGVGPAGTFLSPYAITVTSAGIIYVADYLGLRRGEPARAPAISTQPAAVTSRENTRVSLSVGASGAPAPTYQWRRNGTPVPDATSATLLFAPLRAEHAGDYTVVVTNALGSVTSAVAPLVVNYPPKIAVAPQPTLLGADGTATLTVTANGVGPFTYQWLRNGDPIAGATRASYTAPTAGNYSVAVTNAFGTSTTGAARVEFPTRLVNLSTAGLVTPGSPALVAGFVVNAPGGELKRLLIRAVGPSLTGFGVPDALPQTTVSLLDQRGTVLARNTGWATHPLTVYTDIANTAFSVGAFALAPGSGDSALLLDVPRGNYTVSVGAAGAVTSGRSLLEIYEVADDAARLTNLSTRGQLSPGGGLTIGFVAAGAGEPKLLVRAIGPGLAQFGVTGTLSRPVLTLFNGAERIASNTGWSSVANPTLVEQAAVAVGAFPLARNSADSALLLTLTSGENYTAEVINAEGTPGTVLIEIYQVP